MLYIYTHSKKSIFQKWVLISYECNCIQEKYELIITFFSQNDICVEHRKPESIMTKIIQIKWILTTTFFFKKFITIYIHAYVSKAYSLPNSQESLTHKISYSFIRLSQVHFTLIYSQLYSHLPSWMVREPNNTDPGLSRLSLILPPGTYRRTATLCWG